MLTRRTLLKSALPLTFFPESFVQTAYAQQVQFGSSAIPTLTVEQRRVLNFVLSKASDLRIRNATYNGYDISIRRLQEVTEKVTRRIISPDLDHVPGRSVQELAQLIKNATNQVILGLDFKPNPILEQRLLAQGLCDWMRTHLVYDHVWEKFVGTPEYWKLPYKEREFHFGSLGILSMPTPKCVCAGYSNTTVDVAKAMGLKCYHANGYQRWGMSFSGGWPTKMTHSWDIFELPDGLLIPSDNSISFIPLDKARQLSGRIHHPISLPLHIEEWGIFLAFHYAHDDNSNLPESKQDVYSLLSIPFTEWKSINISALSFHRRMLSMQS